MKGNIFSSLLRLVLNMKSSLIQGIIPIKPLLNFSNFNTLKFQSYNIVPLESILSFNIHNFNETINVISTKSIDFGKEILNQKEYGQLFNKNELNLSFCSIIHKVHYSSNFIKLFTT